MMDAIWTPRPDAIVVAHSYGTGNMGDVTDVLSGARMGIPSIRWVLAFIRLHFVGGTGSADCDIVMDSKRDTAHDVVLDTIASVGTGADANYGILPGEFHLWTFQPDDQLVLQWTNPDSGNMSWAMEAGVAPAGNA